MCDAGKSTRSTASCWTAFTRRTLEHTRPTERAESVGRPCLGFLSLNTLVKEQCQSAHGTLAGDTADDTSRAAVPGQDCVRDSTRGCARLPASGPLRRRASLPLLPDLSSASDIFRSQAMLRLTRFIFSINLLFSQHGLLFL